MDLGLKNKVAIITGGSRGIGRIIALTFAKEGTIESNISNATDDHHGRPIKTD